MPQRHHVYTESFISAAQAKERAWTAWWLALISLKKLTIALVDFCDVRDWQQYHAPKDIAFNQLIEANENAQLLKIKSPQQLAKLVRGGAKGGKAAKDAGRELADILGRMLVAAHENRIDPKKHSALKCVRIREITLYRISLHGSFAGRRRDIDDV